MINMFMVRVSPNSVRVNFLRWNTYMLNQIPSSLALLRVASSLNIRNTWLRLSVFTRIKARAVLWLKRSSHDRVPIKSPRAAGSSMTVVWSRDHEFPTGFDKKTALFQQLPFYISSQHQWQLTRWVKRFCPIQSHWMRVMNWQRLCWFTEKKKKSHSRV
jgi:hypothetical protein